MQLHAKLSFPPDNNCLPLTFPKSSQRGPITPRAEPVSVVVFHNPLPRRMIFDPPSWVDLLECSITDRAIGGGLTVDVADQIAKLRTDFLFMSGSSPTEFVINQCDLDAMVAAGQMPLLKNGDEWKGAVWHIHPTIKGDAVDCWQCDGVGTVEHAYPCDSDAETTPCPTCKGSGKLESEPVVGQPDVPVPLPPRPPITGRRHPRSPS